MDQVIQVANQYAGLLVCGLAALVVVLLVAVLNQSRKITKLQKKYDTLMEGVEGHNLETLLFDVHNKIEDYGSSLKDYKSDLVTINQELKGTIQKVAIKRYNAFDYMGGAQSFSIALLDEPGNGIVLSSIQGRNDSRVYAKSVVQGKTDTPMSEEEIEAVEEAINKKSGISRRG